MFKKISAGVLVLSVLLISISVMFIPTLFTKGVSRASLHKNIDLPLVLSGHKNIELVFFGYTGCSDICTPRLESLAKLYTTLDQTTQKQVGVLFFDISRPLDPTLPQTFARYFHKDFTGIYLDEKVLRNYTKEFSVYFARSLLDKTEFEHTPNLYLLQKHDGIKTLRYVYTAFPYDFKQIQADIKELLNEKS